MANVVLEGKHLKKTFHDARGSFTAIDDVSFVLKEGEYLGIVGESGSGKSTLLRLVAGLVKTDEGTLLHKGAEYTGQSPAKTGEFLQMIFQDACSSFDPRMKLKTSVVEAVKGEICEEDRNCLLERLGLDAALLEKRPAELSGGQCQRMSIARAMLAGAQVLLCDEITSALDVVTQDAIVKLLQEQQKREAFSMMFVSHDIALVSQICSRMIVMYQGKIVEEGPAEQLLSNPQHEYTKKLIASSRRQSL